MKGKVKGFMVKVNNNKVFRVVRNIVGVVLVGLVILIGGKAVYNHFNMADAGVQFDPEADNVSEYENGNY